MMERRKKGKRRETKTPFTAVAPDRQTPWMALAQDSGEIPNMTIEQDEYMPARDRPDWDKNSSFVKRTTDTEVNQTMVRRVKLLYESNPVVSNAVDIFLREIWRGGISITVHFGEREKMVFSAQDKMTKQYFSERLNPEMRAALRDCVLYGFACVRVHAPKMVEVEVEEKTENPDAYVDVEALKAALPDNKEELLQLLREEVENGAAFASSALQEKMGNEGDRFFDGEQESQVGNPIRRVEGSNQLVYEDPDPDARKALKRIEAFYRSEDTPSIEALKTELLAVRTSNRAVEQLAQGEGGGAHLWRTGERDVGAIGDNDLDAFPSFTVLDISRVTQYIRINDSDRREYFVMYNGHTLNRSRKPVPQGMMIVLNEPTLDGILQSAVAKTLPLASQLADLWRNHGLVSHQLARPFLIATTETDKSDPHVASRTMTFGDAAQDGTQEAMEQYSRTVEIKRNRDQESHEIIVDPRYLDLVNRKQDMRQKQAASSGGGFQYSQMYSSSQWGHVHPLLDETGVDDPTDLRDEPYLRKCVMPSNSRLLPNPVPSVMNNMLDVARYLSEQIFVAMGLPAEMYQGGQRKFAANQTLDQMIQDSRIQEFQNAMSTLFQTLLARVFDPLVDEHVYNIATKNGFQTNSTRIKRYKNMANVLVEFHFNVHLSEEQLISFVEQGWLDESAAQTFALRQASIDPKFASKDPAAARRKRMRDAAIDEEKPRTDVERAKIQSAEKIAAENRKSAERTAKANASAKAAAPDPVESKQPAVKKQK